MLRVMNGRVRTGATRRSRTIARARSAGRRIAGAVAVLFLAFALVVEAAPPIERDRDAECVSAPHEDPECLAISGNGAARSLVPAPPEMRIGAIARAIAELDATGGLRSVGEQAPPRIPAGHRKQPTRRARTATTDEAH